MRFLFFLEVFFELADPSLKVGVNFDVSLDDFLHSVDVVVDVVLDLADALHVGYQFSLFGQQLSGFFQVL